MEKKTKEEVTITRPFVSWYCRCVYIIDASRKGSVQILRELEAENEPEKANKIWLCNVYVEKPYRNRGIAAKLIKAAKRYCQRKNVKALYLWCKKDMFKFYEQFGFENTHQSAKDAQGNMLYTMVCTILPLH